MSYMIFHCTLPACFIPLVFQFFSHKKALDLVLDWISQILCSFVTKIAKICNFSIHFYFVKRLLWSASFNVHERTMLSIKPIQFGTPDKGTQLFHRMRIWPHCFFMLRDFSWIPNCREFGQGGC